MLYKPYIKDGYLLDLTLQIDGDVHIDDDIDFNHIKAYKITIEETPTGKIGHLTLDAKKLKQLKQEEAKQQLIAETTKEIKQLKKQLSDNDYKIIKCFECYLTGEELPYNIVALHTERDNIRNTINEKEEIINGNR